MKKLLAVALVLCMMVPCAVAEFSKDDIPAGSDEKFEVFTYSNGKIKSTITGIRFDLDDENMPVMVIMYTVENIGDRSAYPENLFWVSNENLLKTGSSSMLASVGRHYKSYLSLRSQKINEIAPGESVSYELAYQIDNFTDKIYIHPMNSKEINMRIYAPTEINSYQTAYRKYN